MYQAATTFPQYKYWVYVPATYSPDHPAGLHLFFHGNGGQSMAQTSFSMWAPVLLEPDDLIGINMEYDDGTPHVDAEHKAEAANQAVLQVMADYKVIAGRGILVAFSAGGSPAGIYFETHGRAATERGPAWPFCHITIYGSCLRCSSEVPALPTSWCRCFGDGEEAMAPGLCSYMLGRTDDDLKAIANGGCADCFINLTKGRGHTILPDDIQRSATVFRRADILFAPFLYEPDYAPPQVQAIAHLANAGRISEASAAAHKLSSGGSATAEAKHLAHALAERIEARIGERIALVHQLAQDDPVLSLAYGVQLDRQLRGLPAQKELASALAPVRKAQGTLNQLEAAWIQALPTFFEERGCRLRAGMAEVLTQFRAKAGAESHIGLMATKFLAFAGAP